jgi:hypothetical protein
MIFAQTSNIPENITALALLAILVTMMATEIVKSWRWKRQFIDRLEGEVSKRDDLITLNTKQGYENTMQFTESTQLFCHVLEGKMDKWWEESKIEWEQRARFETHVKEEHQALAANQERVAQHIDRNTEALIFTTQALQKLCESLDIKVNGKEKDLWEGEERRAL